MLRREGVHAAVTRVPAVDDAFLKGRSGGESPGALGERVARLSAGVLGALGALGPVAAPLQQQRVQQGLRPVRGVVHSAVKRLMEPRPRGRLVPALRRHGHGRTLAGGGGLRGADRGSVREPGRPGLRGERRVAGARVGAFIGGPGLALGLGLGLVAVELHVLPQGAGVRVALVAAPDLARVRLVAGVHVRVLLPVAAVRKPPVAAVELAFKGFLT